MGILYSWGVIQSSLLSDGLASSRLLSIVGGLEVFLFAGFCIPVSQATRCTILARRGKSLQILTIHIL